MFGGIDPKKMQAMMKQLGMKQETIDAERVVIEKKQGNIVIENPSVTKITMQGQDSFQISGDIEESDGEGEDAQLEKDIKTIMEKTSKPREECALALEKNEGDIAATILELSK